MPQQNCAGDRGADRSHQAQSLSAFSLPGSDLGFGARPDRIAHPRHITEQQKHNGHLGEVTGVDTDARQVLVSNADRKQVPLTYDYLILATGVQQSYFGHDEYSAHAPSLKNLADAVAVRNKILQAFEIGMPGSFCTS
jgi:NADH dehydrogenase FAD-containing subunit